MRVCVCVYCGLQISTRIYVRLYVYFEGEIAFSSTARDMEDCMCLRDMEDSMCLTWSGVFHMSSTPSTPSTRCSLHVRLTETHAVKTRCVFKTHRDTCSQDSMCLTSSVVFHLSSTPLRP